MSNMAPLYTGHRLFLKLKTKICWVLLNLLFQNKEELRKASFIYADGKEVFLKGKWYTNVGLNTTEEDILSGNGQRQKATYNGSSSTGIREAYRQSEHQQIKHGFGIQRNYV